tara:strand:+ start:478 stop:750 length:273 start_codon:yes stop_codon:yes gene_type:complete
MDLYDHIYHKLCRQVYQESIPGSVNLRNKFKEEQEETQNILKKLRQSQEELGTSTKRQQLDVITHADGKKAIATPVRSQKNGAAVKPAAL